MSPPTIFILHKPLLKPEQNTNLLNLIYELKLDILGLIIGYIINSVILIVLLWVLFFIKLNGQSSYSIPATSI